MVTTMNTPFFDRVHRLMMSEPFESRRYKDFITAEEAQKFITENPRWICAAGWVKERGIWRVYYW